MPIRNESVLTEFDADGALQAVLDVIDEDVFVCAEFTPEDFQVLYVSDAALERYDDETDIWVVGDVIHEYMNVDFLEQELFCEMYPLVDETDAFVTYTDYAAIVRVLRGDEGFYLSVATDAPVSRLVEELTSIL